MPLHPVRTTANTAEEHVADHNSYLDEFDLPTHLHVDYVEGVVMLTVSPTAPSSPDVDDLWLDSDATSTLEHTHTGSSVVTPDDVPASPHADDYEFNGSSTSLPSGWSWVNQGGATYQEDFGGGSLIFPGSGSTDIRSIVRAVPAGASWTATAKLVRTKRGAGTGPYGGLILRESSSGKLVMFNQTYHSSDGSVDKYTNNTTYSGAGFGGFAIWDSGRHWYWRIIKNSATSWDFAVSADRKGWATLALAANVGAFCTPDQIGFTVNAEGGVPGALECVWYRVT